jgi:hypothetical protein
VSHRIILLPGLVAEASGRRFGPVHLLSLPIVLDE